MPILYTDHLESLSARDLEGFFVGWPNPPSAERHLEILHRSAHVWLAHDGDSCVGFINAISDGLFYAYVPLLEVRAEYQGRGIGAELVQRLLKSLDHCYAVDLVCDESVAPFYERLKFHRLVGFGRRNYARQSAD